MDENKDERKILFCVDVGTKQSAVSFVYLKPGQPVVILPVTHWPGQDSEIPSVPTQIYYKDSKPVWYGAEATKKRGRGCHLVTEFKRHVHRLPTNPVSGDDRSAFASFPPLVTLLSIYQDWLGYLFKHAAKQFQAYPRMPEVWNELSGARHIIFTVPNRWSEPEQSLLRKAISKADWVVDVMNIHFVRESEASLHFALKHKLFEPELNTDFMICDAGSSTTDIALYHVTKVSPLQVEENENSPCRSIEAGPSLFAENSGMVAGEEVPIADYKGSGEAGSERDIEIVKIMDEIDGLKGNYKPKVLILEGGFCSDDNFQTLMKKRFEPGMRVIQRGDDDSEFVITGTTYGGLYSYLHSVVVARSSPYAYGCDVLVKYNGSLDEHKRRGFTKHPTGNKVKYGWSEIVPYGQILGKGYTRPVSYLKTFTRKSEKLSNIEVGELYAASKGANKEWVFDPDGDFMEGFQPICRIKADFSALQGNLPEEKGPYGKYYALRFQLSVAFGSTTSRAIVTWKDRENKEHSTEARFVPPGDSAEAWENPHISSVQVPAPPPSPKPMPKQQPQSGSSLPSLKGGKYFIYNPALDRYATLHSKITDTIIVGERLNMDDKQKWFVEVTGKETHSIHSVQFYARENKTYAGAKPNEGQNVVGQQPRVEWNIIGIDPGRYRIVLSNKAWSFDTDKNTLKVVTVDKTNENQAWQFVEAD